MISGYGTITDEMLDAIRPFIEGKTVVDLGAGDGRKGKILSRSGAQHVYCVDKNLPGRFRGRKLTWVRGYFTDQAVIDSLPTEIDVAFVSWPQNYRIEGLIPILERAKVVIYIGCNYDGAACGWPQLFLHMTHRELLAEVEHHKNTLLIVGDTLDDMREPTFEERSGIAWASTMTRFEHRPK